MASKVLVLLAKQAAKAAAEAGKANRAWRDAFAQEYGHDGISDVLVGAIDYSTGDTSILTAQFVDQHSAAGQS
jgi:hypothetical protein